MKIEAKQRLLSSETSVEEAAAMMQVLLNLHSVAHMADNELQKFIKDGAIEKALDNLRKVLKPAYDAFFKEHPASSLDVHKVEKIRKDFNKRYSHLIG